MDKLIKILCEQSKIMELNCGNKDCNTLHTLKTKDVFKSKIYQLNCSKCEMVTDFHNQKFIDEFKKQLKDLGVSWQ